MSSGRGHSSTTGYGPGQPQSLRSLHVSMYFLRLWIPHLHSTAQTWCWRKILHVTMIGSTVPAGGSWMELLVPWPVAFFPWWNLRLNNLTTLQGSMPHFVSGLCLTTNSLAEALDGQVQGNKMVHEARILNPSTAQWHLGLTHFSATLPS